MMTILTDSERLEIVEQNAGYARDSFEAVVKATEAAILAKLREQEPVAQVKENSYCPEGTSDELSTYLPVGMKLYAAPQPATVEVPRINYAVIDEYVRDKNVSYNEACRMVRAALAAQKPATVEVPPGYKLVPVEPTREMIAAFANNIDTPNKMNSWSNGYRAMLAAAPQAPAQGTWMQRNAVFVITEAYEAGVGKGMQAAKRGEEVQNPWGDEPCREAWSLGYKEGKERYRPEAPAQAIPTEAGIAWQSGALPAERKAVTVDGRSWYRDDHERVAPEAPAQGIDKETQTMKLMGFVDDLIEQDPDRAERFIESALAKNALRKRLKDKKASEAPAQLPRGECFTNGNICARCGHPEFIEAQPIPAPWREAVKVAREALKISYPIVQNEMFLQDASYGHNFSKGKAEKARKANNEIRAAIAKLDSLEGGE